MTKKISSFEGKVYQELMKIPFGEVRSYKEIATAIGNPKASRAVGNACNKNPFPFIVPCHRVVGSDKSLTGYAYGVDLKRKLLEFERGYLVRCT